MKKILSIAILMVCLSTVLGGCSFGLAKKGNAPEIKIEPVVDSVATSSEKIATTTEEKIATTTEKKKINTLNQQVYRNEEYGFEIKYPQNWYWEDYSREFKRLMIGFYPKNKNKGWEYMGDIKVSAVKILENGDLIKYYEKINGESFKESDKLKEVKTKNGYEAIIGYDIPAFIPYDGSIIKCGNYFIYIDSPFSMARKELEKMTDSIICF